MPNAYVRRPVIVGFFPYTDSFEGSQSRSVYKLSFCIVHSSKYEFVGFGRLHSGCLYNPQLRNKSDRFVTENCLLLVNKDKSANE